MVGLEVGLFLGGQGIEGLLQHGGVVIPGEHIQEVPTHDFRVDVHKQAVLALGHEIPAVVIGLGTRCCCHMKILFRV